MRKCTFSSMTVPRTHAHLQCSAGTHLILIMHPFVLVFFSCTASETHACMKPHEHQSGAPSHRWPASYLLTHVCVWWGETCSSLVPLQMSGDRRARHACACACVRADPLLQGREVIGCCGESQHQHILHPLPLFYPPLPPPAPAPLRHGEADRVKHHAHMHLHL